MAPRGGGQLHHTQSGVERGCIWRMVFAEKQTGGSWGVGRTFGLAYGWVVRPPRCVFPTWIDLVMPCFPWKQVFQIDVLCSPA